MKDCKQTDPSYCVACQYQGSCEHERLLQELPWYTKQKEDLRTMREASRIQVHRSL